MPENKLLGIVGRDIKLTKILQPCYICREPLVKGEERVGFCSGMCWGRFSYIYTHVNCARKEMLKLLGFLG